MSACIGSARRLRITPCVKSTKAGIGRNRKLAAIRADMVKAADRARDYVEKNFEYVGPRFPEEARKIHYGETGERGIFGEATGKEVKELVDEGVGVAPLPGPAKKPDKAGVPKISDAASVKKTEN